MYKVKVLGAGSIGNHLANASRRCGWQVALCDLDPEALERTRSEIYPSRYGAWDDAIELYPAADAPKSVYDLIVIGTPPDAHVDLAIEAIADADSSGGGSPCGVLKGHHDELEDSCASHCGAPNVEIWASGIFSPKPI